MTTSPRAGRWVEADYIVRDADGQASQLTVVSAYVHSGEAGTPKQDEKFRFLDVMVQRLPELAKHSDHALVVGDLNVGHTRAGHQELEGQRQTCRLPARGAGLF